MFKNFSRLFLISAFPAITFAAAAPNTVIDYFSGIRLGVGIGFAESNVTEKVTENGNVFLKTDRGKLGFTGKLFAGYDYVFANRWLIGADAHYQYNPIHVKTTLVSGNTYTGDTTLKNMYGATLRFGFLSSPKLLWFAGIGPEWIDYRHKTSTNAVFKTIKKTRLTASYQLGAEQALSQHWHLSETVSYAAPFSVKATNVNLKTEHKASVFSGLLNLTYVFN